MASVTLTWAPPTENEDSSDPIELSGFTIYTGSSPANLRPVATVGAYEMSYIATNLPTGDAIYFAVTAVNTSGRESAYSNVVSKTFQ